MPVWFILPELSSDPLVASISQITYTNRLDGCIHQGDLYLWYNPIGRRFLGMGSDGHLVNAGYLEIWKCNLQVMLVGCTFLFIVLYYWYIRALQRK